MSIYTADSLKTWDCHAEIKGKWVMARPLSMDRNIFEAIYEAWLVFIGKNDSLKWIGQ